MEAVHLAVARFLRPHGLSGGAVVAPLTDDPGAVFASGRSVIPVDSQGAAIGPALVVRDGRPYRKGWRLEFVGISSRTALEGLRLDLLGAHRSELRPPNPDTLYVHEIPGALVVRGTEVVGIARDLVGVPGQAWLAVDVDGREHLIPFREPIIRGMDRAARRIEVELPPGLLEL